jgi:hypothetical protein
MYMILVYTSKQSKRKSRLQCSIETKSITQIGNPSLSFGAILIRHLDTSGSRTVTQPHLEAVVDVASK